MKLCDRHEDALELALILRGLLRPTLTAGVDETPRDVARDLILTHATHFAGKAAVDMLTAKRCPLCFVNQNPARINLDDWIELAADEALAADIARADQPLAVRSGGEAMH